MTRLEAWALALVLVAGTAGAAECGAAFSDCKEDCLLEYGSIRVEMKRRYAKCMKHCKQEAANCTEHDVEARTNHLDEGALDRSPRAAEPDGPPGDAPPRKAKGKKKRVVAEERETIKNDEEPEKPAPKRKESDERAAPKEEFAPLAKPEPKAAEEEVAPREKEKAPAKRPKAPPKKDDEDDLRNY